MRIILTLLLLAVSQIGISQNDFNKIYCYDFLGATINNMIQFDDTIVTYGIGIDSFVQSLIITKYDTLGVVMDQLLFNHPSGNNFALRDGYEILKTTDGGYICSATVFETRRQFLLRLDQNFRILWSKEYWQSPANIKYPYEIIEIKSGFIIGGRRQNMNATRDIYITKVSHEGVFLWEKIYGEADSAEFMRKMVLTPKQTLLLAANRSNGNDNPAFLSSRAWFLEVDTLGEVQNEWLDDNLKQYSTSDLLLDKNQDIVYIAGDYKYNSDFNVNTIDWHITKRDSNYNLIWKSFPLQRSGGAVSLENILSTQDMGYVTAGYLVNKVPQTNGDTLECYAATLFKTDKNGQPIWQVCDTFDFGVNSDVEYRISSLVELASGSLVMAGTIRRYDTNPSKSIAWMLKYDKNGCRDTFCSFDFSTGIDDTYTEDQFSEVSIYPNPASDNLNIELANDYFGKVEMNLVDIQGKVVFKSSEFISGNYLQLPLNGIPSGIYYVQIIKEDGERFIKKVVIQ